MPKRAASQPPSPSPDSDPQPDAAGSSRGSERVSGSEPAAGFVADPGPEFDPEAPGADIPPPPPPAAEEAAGLIEGWEEEVVESLLGVKGRLLHAVAGVSDQDWVYTDLDLQAIAPPLTRICNRYEPVRRYSRYADPITLLTALSAYTTRSLLERSQELRAQAAEEEEGAGGTHPIPPADEVPPPPPAPATPPRQAARFPTASPGAPPPAMQPSEGPAPPQPPRPAEAPVDPTVVEWEVGG